MKSEKNIVFLGMMGSGKTSIGTLFSKKLNLDFFDVDNFIEKDQGMKISLIFKEKGEKFFRELEEKITLNILKKRGVVIALGGGAFMNSKIRKEILINHFSFWLNLDSQILIKRIISSKKRPIAFNSTKNELVKIIKKRANFYAKALYKVDCGNLTKTEIVNKIINIYESSKINN
jgi:shikimate kinase